MSLAGMLEQTAANALAKTLPLKIALAGIDVIQKRQVPSAEMDFYGKAAGSPKDAKLRVIGPQRILMGASHWRIMDGNEVGYLDQPEYMYCLFDLRDGDILTVVRKDKEEFDFTASQVQEIGNTLTIIKRFIMSNINGG